MLTKARWTAQAGLLLAAVAFAGLARGGEAPIVAPPAGATEEFHEGALARDPQSVFFVQRSKNRNEVHYAVALDEACRPLGDEPVRNYWRRLEEGPNVTKALSFLQQRAYGFENQRVIAEGVQVLLHSLPERPIAVVGSRSGAGCAADAYLDIGGRRARLERIYVSAEDGLLRPEVKFIDLFARRDDGAPVTERLEPK